MKTQVLRLKVISNSGQTKNSLMEQSTDSPREDVAVTPVVSFIGGSNSGKTVLLEKVVAELKARGHRVAVIKHSPHGFDIDRPGKDTWRLAQAGSDIVAVSSPDRIALIQRVDEELTLEQVVALVAGKIDIVLTEGYKFSNAAKVVVQGIGQSEEPPNHRGEILATISARLSDMGVPQFDPDDMANIMALLIAQVRKRQEASLPSIRLS